MNIPKVTNLSKATDIVRIMIDAREAKSAILDKLVLELTVTRSNAFVYFTKATKALGFTITDGTKTAKVKAPAKAKANAITETSPEKAAAKVAEIDKVIAGLRASGVKVASPFAALGV